jgi:hypothetical protein
VTKLPEDFTDLLVELCAAQVEFLVVGGWAVVLHGHDIGRAALIQHKRSAGRHKDLADVEELERSADP